jgi:hypothetical protein
MSDDPISLDGHRTPEGKMATEMRRHSLKDFEADQEALRRRRDELEAQLSAEPARTWPEAAAEAQYLIRCYAGSAGARDERRGKLIERALGDLARPIAREERRGDGKGV